MLRRLGPDGQAPSVHPSYHRVASVASGSDYFELACDPCRLRAADSGDRRRQGIALEDVRSTRESSEPFPQNPRVPYVDAGYATQREVLPYCPKNQARALFVSEVRWFSETMRSRWSKRHQEPVPPSVWRAIPEGIARLGWTSSHRFALPQIAIGSEAGRRVARGAQERAVCAVV